MTAIRDSFDGVLGSRLGRRSVLGGMLGVSALALAACGTAATTGAASGAAAAQQVNMTVVPGMLLGPDGKMHDAFVPANLSVTQNRPVQVTVYNFDDMPHSVTAPALQLNAKVEGSTKKGVPAVTTFTFTPTKAGKFLWNCDLPCDDDANGWAMANPGYMSGYITVAGA